LTWMWGAKHPFLRELVIKNFQDSKYDSKRLNVRSLKNIEIPNLRNGESHFLLCPSVFR